MFRYLTSFHYHRETDLAAIGAAYGGPYEVFADSGAFSAATTGSTIKLADYAAWLHQWRHVITTAATLDVIGDPDATHRNTLALEDQGIRVLPVFHIGSPWRRLEALCASYRYIALGGMVPYARRTDDVMRWLIRAFRIARHHGAVYHGFGQTRFATIAALPFYTVDSSSWASGARFGVMSLWDSQHSRIVQLTVGRPAEARKHAGLLRTHGADPAVVGRRGFATKAGKPPEQFQAEDTMIRATPAVAYGRLGRWLERRHHVAPPPGWTSTGTGLFLADTDTKNFTVAARALAADARKDNTS
ncbi:MULTISPECIES: hypothetical protein [Streptomycetaceae]|uniref:Mycobacteriophage GP2 protein n=1 Tax=Streptantibioticus cattleyicolor (strain ATCC 35852 / DSM 46488 / JCM 4925 / NBRC 14057 / NRRL 8057) TaxID=1003195 RepID=G8WRD4_STREN|nr:hypothetical protein [Streptantibioticus cattleyicolor]AEW92951.1 mycobacteriophage GP2 protein [Streptantibioticus cattleyicolor NRRL 8057 = DSM 46488]MYS57698.1 hypothetical protein [Streptomyces sp. SID5468]